MHKQVEMFLKNLKPDDRSIYLYIPAVNAGEYYGANSWGDYFPEESLKKYYRTFYNAKVYRSHKNTDPKKSVGDVVLSLYNDDLHRVELIVQIFRELAKDIAEKADSGKPVGFSMGCRVPFEICSHCSKKFYKTSDRCDHLRHYMNEFLDGKPVYAINNYPDFFDISETPSPADNTIWSIKKVASRAGEASDKTEGKVASVGDFLIEDLAYVEKMAASIEQEDLDLLARCPFTDVLKEAHEVGIYLKPEEYQYLYLTHRGEGELAKVLYSNHVSFLDYDIVVEKCASVDSVRSVLLRRPGGDYKPNHKAHSTLKKYQDRYSELSSNKDNTPKQVTTPPEAVSGLMQETGENYAGYRVAATDATAVANQVSETMLKSSSGWVAPVGVGLGASYFLSADAWRRARTGKPVPTVEKVVAENPAISAALAGLATHQVTKRIKK